MSEAWPKGDPIVLIDLATRQLHDFRAHDRNGDIPKHLACKRCSMKVSLIGRVLARGDGACEI